MIACLDSSFDAPTEAAALAARAAGIRVWAGYLATMPGVGLAAPWTELAFFNARRCGSTPIAFVSGRDDPAAVRRLAAAWRVRACLDVEDGIRPDGPWVPGWLETSGAGLYGLGRVHRARRAAFHIVARYPGSDPGATWEPQTPRPPGPCGWQWQGTHTEFGHTVDRSWLDDWFDDQAEPAQARQGGDSVGGFIPYELPADATGTQALGEVYVAGGEARWGVWLGGAGSFESYTGELTSLGSPDDARDLLEASGTHAVHQGVLRLCVRGVRPDGSRWVAVYDAHSFGQIQPWIRTPSTPNQDVPKGEPGPPGPDVRPAVAAALEGAAAALRPTSGT